MRLALYQAISSSIISIIKNAKYYLNIVIEDNGIGINSSTNKKQATYKDTSLGIAFTEKRLKRLSEFCKTDYALHIQDISDIGGGSTGTKVTIVVYGRLKELVEMDKNFPLTN